MAVGDQFIVGEFVRKIDERHRITLPPELADALGADEDARCMLVKERYGSLSIWSMDAWKQKVESGIDVVRAKMQAGRLSEQVHEVQRFARLLSTRATEVEIKGRGRFVVPAGFRQFLAVKPGKDCVAVGAGVCVELWHPTAWRMYLKAELPQFKDLFEELS